MTVLFRMPYLVLIAFLWDGSSYHTLRVRYDSYYDQQSKTKVNPEHKGRKEEGKKPGKGVGMGVWEWEYGSVELWKYRKDMFTLTI
jgi:hypothetical protein